MTNVYIISAPSGSGKSTLVNSVRKIIPGLDFSISYTTRKPRGDEQNGREYFFVQRAEFDQMLRNDEFLEHAEVFGNYYGTARRFLRQAEHRGHDLLLDIDVQGARQLKKRVPAAVSIFILAPSRQILEQRLRARSQDSPEVIERRLREAAEEIRNYHMYDYVLVNREVNTSVETLVSIIEATRSRRERMEQEIRPILESFENA